MFSLSFCICVREVIRDSGKVCVCECVCLCVVSYKFVCKQA